MRKLCIAALVVLCLVSVMTIGVSARAIDPFISWEANGETHTLSAPLVSMVGSFLSVIPGITTLVSHLPAIAVPFLYAVIVLALLPIAVVGYRNLTFIRATLGAVAGYFAGLLLWNFVITWKDMPASVLALRGTLQWVVIAMMVVLFSVGAVMLRRVGTAIAFSLVAGVCLLPCVRHIWVWIGVIAFLFAFSMLRSRASVILLSSFAIPTFLMFLIVGPNGYYPVDFGNLFSGVVNPLLLIGLIAGTILSMVHFRLSRKMRA